MPCPFCSLSIWLATQSRVGKAGSQCSKGLQSGLPSTGLRLLALKTSILLIAALQLLLISLA